MPSQVLAIQRSNSPAAFAVQAERGEQVATDRVDLSQVNIENDRWKPGRRRERGFDSGSGLQSGERLRKLWPESLIFSLSEEHAAGLRELLERRRRPVTEAGSKYDSSIPQAPSGPR